MACQVLAASRSAAAAHSPAPIVFSRTARAKSHRCSENQGMLKSSRISTKPTVRKFPSSRRNTRAARAAAQGLRVSSQARPNTPSTDRLAKKAITHRAQTCRGALFPLRSQAQATTNSWPTVNMAGTSELPGCSMRGSAPKSSGGNPPASAMRSVT